MVDSISIEDLYRDHNSYSRNSVIAKHLYASLHIEKRGFGTIRMVKYMKELGLEEPIFENVGNDFVVTLYGPESTDFIEKSFETDLGPIHPTRKVLILSANPTTTPKLLLDEEVRKIKEGLRRSKNRDRFEIKSKFGMRLKDFRRTLLDHEPQIVHFIGHGTKEGLLVEDEIGMAVLFPAKALSGLFKLCSKHVECVILSACYSATQAEAISKHIKYIIGMRKEIKDKASIEFAVGFYDALGAGKSVETAFEFGRNAVLQMFPDIAEYNIPILIKRV